MPIYEYRCHDCGKIFEYIQRMADDPKTACEACDGSLERLISQSAFVLKGGGWYKDLYASPKPAAGSSDAAGAEKSTGEGGAAVEKAGAKPEAKPAPASEKSSAGKAGD